MHKVNVKSYDMFKSNRTSQTLVILSTLCYILYRSLKIEKSSNEVDLAEVMINEHDWEIAPFKTQEKWYKQRTGSQNLKHQVFNKSKLRDL